MMKVLVKMLAGLEKAEAMLSKIAAGGSYPAGEYYAGLLEIRAAIAEAKLEKIGEAYGESI